MAGQTPNINLNTFDGGDTFSTVPFNENWGILDTEINGTQTDLSSLQTSVGTLTSTVTSLSSTLTTLTDLVAATPAPATVSSSTNTAKITSTDVNTPTRVRVSGENTYITYTFTRSIKLLVSVSGTLSITNTSGSVTPYLYFGAHYKSGNDGSSGWGASVVTSVLRIPSTNGSIFESGANNTPGSLVGGFGVTISNSRIISLGAGTYTFEMCSWKANNNVEFFIDSYTMTIVPLLIG